MLRRRAAQGAFAIGLLTVLLALPACTADDDPPTDPPAPLDTTSAASTASPRPTTPLAELIALPMPDAAMSQPNEAGADAAARYFVQLYDYAFATKQLDSWETISGDTCEFCADVAAQVRSLEPGHVLVQAGPTAVTSIRAWEISEDQWFGADMILEQPPTDEFDSSGRLVSTGGDGTVRLALAMTWNGGWTVNAADVLDPDETPKW